MTDDKVLEQLNQIITEKIDSALKPIFEKLDALTPPPDDEEKPEEKLDVLTIAKETLRSKLDGFIPAEKLDAMDLIQMSQTLAKLQTALTSPTGGILNPVGGSTKKTDAFRQALERKKLDEVVFE